MTEKKKKFKIVAIAIASLVVFATTFFAMADNKNGNSLFLDSDQDGLTDQEENTLGTNPRNADTDGDGYSDGKEVESGYDPLKAAPGDKIVLTSSTAPDNSSKTKSASQATETTEEEDTGLLAGVSDISDEESAELEYDPENPNLTNQMIGQLMQLTTDKISADSNFVENPNYSADDYNQIVQNSLQAANVSNELPEISDSEINILPEVSGKKMSDEEIKEKQKTEIEKYLAQVAFIMASNAPFEVKDITNLESSVESENATLVSALSAGNFDVLEKYSQKAQAGIDQLKKVEVPYILKDIHKSMLQLAIYTADLKDSIVLDANDPMKSLAALSTIQSVAEKASQTQEELMDILDDYGIEFIKFPE